jgi:hypothetical protein
MLVTLQKAKHHVSTAFAFPPRPMEAAVQLPSKASDRAMALDQLSGP